MPWFRVERAFQDCFIFSLKKKQVKQRQTWKMQDGWSAVSKSSTALCSALLCSHRELFHTIASSVSADAHTSRAACCYQPEGIKTHHPRLHAETDLDSSPIMWWRCVFACFDQNSGRDFCLFVWLLRCSIFFFFFVVPIHARHPVCHLSSALECDEKPGRVAGASETWH